MWSDQIDRSLRYIKSRAAAQQQQKTRKKTISIFRDCERRGNQSTRAISYCWWPLILISSVCSGSCTSSPRTIVRCHHQISLVDVHILGTSHKKKQRIKCLWPIFNRKKSILSPRVCALCMAVKKRSNWCQPVYFFFVLVDKLRIYSNSRSFSTSSHFAFSFFLSASLFIHTQLPDLSCRLGFVSKIISISIRLFGGCCCLCSDNLTDVPSHRLDSPTTTTTTSSSPNKHPTSLKWKMLEKLILI